MKNAGKLTAIMIAAFSLLLVFGALFTALAETGFTAFSPTKTKEPTATTIFLPTKVEQPATEQPTQKVVKTNPPEKTQEPTKTQPAPITKTATATESAVNGTCTRPTGWVDYKIRSGDTLYSISLLFQTDVDTIKNANCLTTNQIITGEILWVPGNATLTPTKTSKPTETAKPADGCYTLTLSHLGEGADAVPDIPNSEGCAAGKYKEGEVISLTAKPATGWNVGSWYGTINDSSTELTNKVKMPAKDHLAKPVYVGICYPLTISSGANGGDPSPDKLKSSGCNNFEYVAGEKITFTAAPATGYTVDKWSGTNDDSLTSLTNKLTMPASAASVSVTYKLIPPVCFTLTLGVTSGNGSVPTASASTMGCPAGKFAAGETNITVTAAPASGGAVVSWQTSLAYSTTADPNVIKVTMGVADSSVYVTYNP